MTDEDKVIQVLKNGWCQCGTGQPAKQNHTCVYDIEILQCDDKCNCCEYCEELCVRAVESYNHITSIGR